MVKQSVCHAVGARAARSARTRTARQGKVSGVCHAARLCRRADHPLAVRLSPQSGRVLCPPKQNLAACRRWAHQHRHGMRMRARAAGGPLVRSGAWRPRQPLLFSTQVHVPTPPPYTLLKLFHSQTATRGEFVPFLFFLLSFFIAMSIFACSARARRPARPSAPPPPVRRGGEPENSRRRARPSCSCRPSPAPVFSPRRRRLPRRALCCAGRDGRRGGRAWPAAPSY